MKLLRKKTVSKSVASFFVIAFSAQALAAEQSLQSLPSLFDPGQVSQRVGGSLPPPALGAPISEQIEKPAGPLSAQQKIRFKLTKIILEGNTVFSSAQIAELYQADLNKSISLYDLQVIVENITKKYRAAGYVLSRAILPPQEIKNGVVRVQIIEGFINDVTVNGDAGNSQALLLKYGAHVQGTHPLQIADLEHYMLLANDLPGYKVTAVLTPAKNTPGAADLILNVTRQRASFYASNDNYGTRYLGPNQNTVSVSTYSLFAPGSSDTFRAVETTIAKELKYGEYTHTQVVGSQGLNVVYDANYTETRPDFTLEPLDIIGRNLTTFVDLSYPLIRMRNKNLFVHGEASYQNVTSTILATPFYQDRIRSIIVGAFFNNTDRWFGFNTAAIDFEHGFPILGAHDHLLMSRPQGQTIFTKANVVLSRLQGLSPRFSLFGAIHGQYTDDALLATEQFTFGGSDYGRGYDPSEIVGDRGSALKVELRMDTTPGLRFLQAVQYFGFYDAGIIWNIDNVNLPGRQTAMSAGVGARVGFLPFLSGNFVLAKPLTLPVATMQILGRNAKAPRGFFQVVLNI